MAAEYPVTFDLTRPEKFERPQLALRLLVVLVLSLLANAIGWFFGLIYLAIPIAAAVLISQRGSEGYVRDEAPRVTSWLRWIVAAYSYLALLTDRLPTEKPEAAVSFNLTPGGSPTVGSALLRLLYSIPSAFVLALLGIVAAVIWIIAAVFILVQENYPEGLFNVQLGIMRWHARLLAYHASLVEQYPPFSLDTGARPPAAGA